MARVPRTNSIRRKRLRREAGAVIPHPPPADGTIIDDGSFEIPPAVEVAPSGVIKFNGKKASGASGKFVYDIKRMTAGQTITVRYQPDWSQLANGGVSAFVGFGFKHGNSFHLAGLKGDGASGLDAYRISGTQWAQATGHTLTNGGAAEHGAQGGPNWLQISTSADGAIYTLRTSADGVTWAEEFTAAPTPFAGATTPPTFGIAVFLESADAGQFSVAISLWRAEGGDIRITTGGDTRVTTAGDTRIAA